LAELAHRALVSFVAAGWQAGETQPGADSGAILQRPRPWNRGGNACSLPSNGGYNELGRMLFPALFQL
jgi:hypothetical protein